MTERVGGVRRAAGRRSAISRKISLPVSAQECAASASSDADPVSTAADVFATAMRTLTPNATRTVIRLSDPPGSRGAGTELSRS